MLDIDTFKLCTSAGNEIKGRASVLCQAIFRIGALFAMVIGSGVEGYVMVSSKELSGSISIGP